MRILQHRFAPGDLSQFLVSTRPQVAPQDMVRFVKGRLQYLVRRQYPRAFRRKYSFRSVGSVTREVIERYVESQHGRHPMADARVQEVLQRYCVVRPDVDLSAAQESAHARFWYNLHIVMVNAGRWRETDCEVLERVRDMIVRAAQAKSHLLSRAGILADHIHVALGCRPSQSPLDVALSYMNNLAFACGMRPIFRFSVYMGTFGEYDLSVPGFWRDRDESSLHGDKPRGGGRRPRAVG